MTLQVKSLTGELTIAQLGRGEVPLADICANCQVDLSQVARIDSAGIAYLLECRQNLQQQDLQLTFSGVSEALLKLAKLYDLADIFLEPVKAR